MEICDSLPTKNSFFLLQIIYPICNSYMKFSWASKYAIRCLDCRLVSQTRRSPNLALSCWFIFNKDHLLGLPCCLSLTSFLHGLSLTERIWGRGLSCGLCQAPRWLSWWRWLSPGHAETRGRRNQHHWQLSEASRSVESPQCLSSGLALALTTTRHLLPMTLGNCHSSSGKEAEVQKGRLVLPKVTRVIMGLGPGLRAFRSTVVLTKQLLKNIALRFFQKRQRKRREECPGVCLFPVI